MKLALYLGCLIPTEQYAYEISTREVLPRLGVDLADLKGFACCGTPVRSINSLGWLYLSARVMAIAEEADLDLLPLCNTCHLSLCTTRDTLQNVDGAKTKVNSLLADEGLKYEGNHRVWHVVELLHDQIGLEKIRSVAKRSLKDVKFASHIGCHAIRPNELGRIDNPENPRKLDELIEALGGREP